MVLKMHNVSGLWAHKRGGFVLQCISTHKLWSLKRGGLSREWSLKRGTTVYIYIYNMHVCTV